MPKYVLIILLLLCTCSASAQPYKYLVMKGGGIRGIAYCGALKVLEEKNISPGIEKVAGTSVGAMVATLFSIGFSATEIEHIMMDLEIKSFNDGQWSIIGGQKRVRKKYGWYKGDRLERWLGKLIKEKTGSENTTLLQLHELAKKQNTYKDLYVTATNLSKQRLEIFSWETYPNLPIKTAVRASASVPLYYRAVLIDSTGSTPKKGEDNSNFDVFTDGGLLANYPITLFNEKGDTGINKYTLGLKLDRPEQIAYYGSHKGLAPFHIHSFRKYVGALYNVTIEQLNPSLPYATEAKNTIYISNSNLSPRVRRITKEQKKQLYENGKVGAALFFK